MKRFLLVVAAAALVALGIWFAMRSGALRASSASVTALMPKGTIAFVHMPDVNGTRAKWHETDLYKLWREPALQDFLQKPLAKSPETDAVQQNLERLEALQMKDAFVALLALENEQPKILGGFRFKGTSEDAEKVVGQWRGHLQQATPDWKHETVSYEKHSIEVATHETLTFATVYDGDWFFAANDLAALKMVLDRADGRLKDAHTTLTADENFAASFKQMPASYAVLAYGRLDEYFARLAAKLPQDGSANEQATMLRQIRSICAATTFDSGKMRDLLFVGMPKMVEPGNLTRSSLSLATTDSFLYLASFLNLPQQMPAQNATGNGFPPAMQGLLGAFAAKGITLEYWKSAFAPEFGVIGEWAQNARTPSLFATLPVKDSAKAREIMATITADTVNEMAWTRSEKNGVQYFTKAPANPMVPIGPTIGLSDQLFVAGLDLASVESAMQRASASSSGLAAAPAFKSAEALVPAPTHAFGYFDTALFYTRLDAAVRPMLIMAAAFMPSVADTVDLSKLPAAEVITRHLSPFVMSQHYQDDGYRVEAIGPISLYQIGIGAAAVSMGAKLYEGDKHLPFVAPPMPGIMAAPTPEPEESPEPDETPDSQE